MKEALFEFATRKGAKGARGSQLREFKLSAGNAIARTPKGVRIERQGLHRHLPIERVLAKQKAFEVEPDIYRQFKEWEVWAEQLINFILRPY